MGSRAVRALAGVLFVITLAIPADCAQNPIAGIEVSTQVARARTDLVRTIRLQVQRQLETLDWGSARPTERFILSATLVRLDTEPGDGGSKSSCALSVALRESRRGALRAVIDSGSRAEGSDAAQTEDAALRAAVRSAVTRVPESVAKQRR